MTDEKKVCPIMNRVTVDNNHFWISCVKQKCMAWGKVGTTTSPKTLQDSFIHGCKLIERSIE